jgi:ferrochelatase
MHMEPTLPSANDATPYDAVLILGFGGPEGPDDVMPFLENVTRGRGVPRERLLEVATHYERFGGVSPINGQMRELIEHLQPSLRHCGIELPIYWGNRNWHPFLADTMRQMTGAGVRHALGVVLSGFGSYSSCRQYREDVERARDEAGPGAPRVDKLRLFYNHPGFVAANARQVREALDRLGTAGTTRVVFTAHSLPESMARNCRYEVQLLESCRLVADSLGLADADWSLVYQSRSGRPQDPWLGPDIVEHIEALHEQGVESLVIHPIGFVSDHMEVVFDLDEQAAERCRELGIRMERSATVGTERTFVRMLAELVAERLSDGSVERRAIGSFGPSHDVCPVDCCLPPLTPGRPPGR